MPHDDYHIRPTVTPDPGEAGLTPRVHRPRIGGQIMEKLDEILEHVRGDGGENDGRPEVTFEPEASQLPTTAELSGEGDGDDEGGEANGQTGTDDVGTGEGTTNIKNGRRRSAFRFPHRHRAGVH